MNAEEWRLVPGFDEMYEVSDHGRVRSWKRGKWGRASSPRLMNPGPMNTGYPRVTFSHNNVSTFVLVHRLVAEVFLGPCPPDKDQVAHLDGDRLNPRAENLMWATQAENESHKVAHGTAPRGEMHWRSVLTNEDVREIRRLYGRGHSTAAIAEMFNVKRGAVQRVTSGSGWAHVA